MPHASTRSGATQQARSAPLNASGSHPRRRPVLPSTSWEAHSAAAAALLRLASRTGLCHAICRSTGVRTSTERCRGRLVTTQAIIKIWEQLASNRNIAFPRPSMEVCLARMHLARYGQTWARILLRQKPHLRIRSRNQLVFP